jgi:HNH endonuclease
MPTTDILKFVARMDQKQFWSSIISGSESGCWEADSLPERSGYPVYKGYPVYRLIFAIQHGKSVSGDKEAIFHTCGNKWCCNPAHIVLGTQSQKQKMVDRSPKTREKNRKERLEKYGSTSSVLARIVTLATK